jgi:ATP-dependent RNA helicase RhlE
MTRTQTGTSKASFRTFGLGKPLLRALEEAGFDTPRPIQARALPAVLEGRDVLGLAQTGTGKTAAFALPILERLASTRGRGGPRALVVAPTRELALQIQAEFDMLGKYLKVRTATVFGGVGAAPQVRALRSRPDVVVACPGRLLDLASSGDADLSGVEVLVLDEADHMFDMGFLPDVRRILDLLPKRRQNLLFSATMPREIRGLAERVLSDPHTVELAHSAPAETIDHALYPVERERKTDLLQHLLGEEGFRSAIVFLRTKHRARRLARDLDRAGRRAVALQGNMSQGQRQRAMQGFRDGTYDVLVATDIAARGIDVAKVSHVINYDLPNTPDAYTHRIGRTGRAEQQGKACTFVTDEDWDGVKDIERKLGMAIPRVHLDGYSRTRRDREVERSGGAPRSGGGRAAQQRGDGRREAAGGGRGRGGRSGSARSTGGARPAAGGRGPQAEVSASRATHRATEARPAQAFGAGLESAAPARAGEARPAKTGRRIVGAGTRRSSGDGERPFGAGLDDRRSGGSGRRSTRRRGRR